MKPRRVFLAGSILSLILMGVGCPNAPVSKSDLKTPTTNTQESRVISYDENGFSPSTLTIKAGETVTFKNNGTRSMWPATAMHPAHRGYSGTSLSEHCPDTANVTFDACRSYLPGESWPFTFQKVGTWPYHDHVNGGFYGKVVVE